MKSYVNRRVFRRRKSDGKLTTTIEKVSTKNLYTKPKLKLSDREAGREAFYGDVEEILQEMIESLSHEASDLYLGEEVRRTARGCLGTACLIRDQVRKRFACIRPNPGIEHRAMLRRKGRLK